MFWIVYSKIRMPVDHNPKRFTKVYEGFAKKTDLKEIRNFQSKLDILTWLKKSNSSALVFLVMKIKKNIHSMCPENVVTKNMLIYY